MRFNSICVLLTTICIWDLASAGSSDDLKRLKTKLFAEGKYDKNIRPVVNQSDAIQMGILMGIQTIEVYDTSSGLLETHGFILTQWNDEHLVWNNTEFSDIKFIRLPSEDIWTPTLIYMYGEHEDVQVSELTVYSDGNVSWLSVGKLRTYCEIDVHYYPLDKHKCVFTVYSSYFRSEMLMQSLISFVDTEYLNQHGEWDITNTRAVIFAYPFKYFTELSDAFEGYVNIDRRPAFSLIHKGIPMLLMIISTFSVHAVPLVSGERISFSVTLFLAIVFWQATISEDLPKASTQVTLMSILMSVAMCGSTLAMIASVILCRMSVEQLRPIPSYLRKLAERRIRKEVGNTTTLSNVKPDGTAVNEEANAAVESRPQSEITWLIVADSIDVILFYVVFISQLIIALVVIILFCIYKF